MRVHIFVTLFLVGIFSAGVLAYGLLNDFKTKSINDKITEAQAYGKRLSNQMILSGYLSGANQAEINNEMSIAAELNNGRFIVVDGSLRIIYDTYGREEGKTLLVQEVIKCLRGINSSYTIKANQYAELTLPLTNTETKEVFGVVIMNVALNEAYVMTQTLKMNALIMIISISVVLLMIAFIYSSKMTRPLKEIVRSINHVTEGYMDDDVIIKGYYEIDKISDAFNDMLHRIKQMENSRQEFVSNVSHELKTPMTSIKVLADSLIQQDGAPVELYREFLVDINDEIERENIIINDLLSLVKLDKNTGEMHIAQVNINDLLEIILKRLKPIAQKRNIELLFESYRMITAEIDEVKLSLAVSNLIENAIKYNLEDGWVRVSLNADHKYFYVKVSDSGIGIPEEAKDQIFDRFYRVDRARTRQTGGTGLGLSIAKSVVLMHNGAIKLTSKENEGTTFTMRIPLNYVA